MIIFAYGADTFRSRRFVQELKNKFTRDIDPLAQSLSIIDGQAATLKEINEKINTGSLFVQKRLIAIDNIFKNKKADIFLSLTEYLKDLSAATDTIVIFRDEELDTREKPLKADAKKFFAFLCKQQYSQEFSALSGIQLLAFIKKELSVYEKEIETAAANLLINTASSDIWIIINELNKLAHYTANKIITINDVKELGASSFNENIFGLTDALSSKNRKLALSLLEEQYAAGLSDEYLLTMLTRQFKILLQIKEALESKTSQSDMAGKLKLHPFIIKKGLMQAKNFSGSDLKNYLNRLIRLDFLNKTGQGHIKTELMLIISEL